MRTIGTALSEQKGFGPGFDFLRLGLALMVMLFHTAAAVGAEDAWERAPFWIVTFALLPMFFALSGFLISGSAMRLPLVQFLINRGLRILPALAVEIILSALVIGPYFTTLPLRIYFSSPQFFHYFTNIIGLINYNLPGVFYENGQPGIVNAALWTIPYEVLCYLLISIVIIFSLLNRPWLLVIGIALLTFVPTALEWVGLDQVVKHISIVHWFMWGRGTILLPSFLCGCLLYALRDHVPLDKRLFFGCILILAAVSLIDKGLIIHTCNLSWLLCLSLTYITVYIGLAKMPRVPIISNGDYSYGIYLYHCPIINGVYYFTTWNHSTALLFIMSLPFVVMFAAFSWQWIEKPILKLRKKFSFVGKRLH